MKKLEKLYVFAALLAVLGWWGFLYPEFSVTRDNVNIIYSDTSAEDVALLYDLDVDSLPELLLSAPREKIKFRSGILKDIISFWEVFSWK